MTLELDEADMKRLDDIVARLHSEGMRINDKWALYEMLPRIRNDLQEYRTRTPEPPTGE